MLEVYKEANRDIVTLNSLKIAQYIHDENRFQVFKYNLDFLKVIYQRIRKNVVGKGVA